MPFAHIPPVACLAALPLLAGALWLLNRACRPASRVKHLFAAVAGLLAAALVILWMFRGDFPGDIPVAMLYLTALALIQAWFLSAEGAARQ